MFPPFPSPLRLTFALRLGWAFAALATVVAASDLRFSVSIDATERTACGLTRLSSDQVAVIDALVRRDTGRFGESTPAPEAGKEARPAATFSARLTPGERQTAGLGQLTPAELARLDAVIERHQNARLARSLLSPPVYAPQRRAIIPTERKKEREIHGSFSLSYGVGSGGYSEKSGSMVLTLEDPAKGYSVAVGYSETHTKGGVPYYLHRDPLLDRTPHPLDDPFRP